MSPEAYQAGEFGCPSDIWALGTTFLQILTVLEGLDLDDMFLKHGKKDSNQGVTPSLKVATYWLHDLEQRRYSSSIADRKPLVWIQDMLCTHPEDRLSAKVIYEKIVDHRDGHFCGICCRKEAGENSETNATFQSDIDRSAINGQQATRYVINPNLKSETPESHDSNKDGPSSTADLENGPQAKWRTEPRSVQESSDRVKAAGLQEDDVDGIEKDFQKVTDYVGHKQRKEVWEKACYDGKPVIIQWAHVCEDCQDSFECFVAGTIKACGTTCKSDDVPCLKCIGYTRILRNRSAVLYKPPPGSLCKGDVCSLEDVMKDAACKPSLNQRMTVAQTLCDAAGVAQVEWLCRNIQPTNVLLFNTAANCSQQREEWKPYLGSYYLAKFSAKPDGLIEWYSTFDELYEPPRNGCEEKDLLADHFDLYSLGCTLIELALWEPYPKILWRQLQHYHGCDTQSRLTDADGDSVNTTIIERRIQTMLANRAI